MPDAKDILKKYGKKLESEIGSSSDSESDFSKEYSQFKSEMAPEISSYEKWAKSLGSFIKINVAEKDRAIIQKNLNIAHLDITPQQVVTLSLVSMFVVFLSTILIVVAISLITSSISFANLFILGFLGVVASLFVLYYTYSMPKRLANAWRLKTSSQMVPAILYVVVYMKHTSNLEKAIEFASQHLEGYLALDFKKVFYDVEIGKYSTIKDSLESYLENWRDYSPEFIESFHLVESSLYEPSEQRRIEILEKSLQVILDGVYEKMLRYSREIRSPLTNVYMLGIILPTLALALLPLASALLQGAIQWIHVAIIFNIIIPFMVFYMTSEVLLKRPGGHGESSVLELNPEYKKYKSSRPWLIAALILIPLLLIGMTPFISYYMFNSDPTAGQLDLPVLDSKTKLYEFISSPAGGTVGPFGSIAVLLSLFIPLGIALFFSTSYAMKTKTLIKTREDTQVLEEEFNNTLFQLGNRLGDGIPAEIAFAKVAESTRGQKTEGFFSIVNQNIQQLGMSVERAIFDKRRGAIVYYPSALIATSMRILVESVKKGLRIAAQSLMSISEYVKNIQKINQRLRDLLAEIVSDMKSNMVFLAPLLAGIVVGLSTMIATILLKLDAIQKLAGAGGEALNTGFFDLSSIMKIFAVDQMIPPYFLQITIGIYLIEIIFILNAALVTVDAGKDPLKEKSELSKNLRAGMLLYTITAAVAILALSILASVALSGLGV